MPLNSLWIFLPCPPTKSVVMQSSKLSQIGCRHLVSPSTSSLGRLHWMPTWLYHLTNLSRPCRYYSETVHVVLAPDDTSLRLPLNIAYKVGGHKVNDGVLWKTSKSCKLQYCNKDSLLDPSENHILLLYHFTGYNKKPFNPFKFCNSYGILRTCLNLSELILDFTSYWCI